MPKPAIVSYPDVCQVCQELIDAGEKITVDAVYRGLGRKGSKATVLKLVQQYREENPPKRTPSAALPPGMEEAWAAFGQKREDEGYARAQEEIKTIKSDHETAVKLMEETEGKLAEAEDKIVELTSDLSDERSRNMLFQGRLDEVLERLEGGRKKITADILQYINEIICPRLDSISADMTIQAAKIDTIAGVVSPRANQAANGAEALNLANAAAAAGVEISGKKSKSKAKTTAKTKAALSAETATPEMETEKISDEKTAELALYAAAQQREKAAVTEDPHEKEELLARATRNEAYAAKLLEKPQSEDEPTA